MSYHTHTRTDTQTQIHRHAHRHTDTRTDTQTHRHRHRHTNALRCSSDLAARELQEVVDVVDGDGAEHVRLHLQQWRIKVGLLREVEVRPNLAMQQQRGKEQQQQT